MTQQSAPTVQPTGAQVQEALQAFVEQEMQRFAGNLELARSVYRGAPALVKAAHYPKEWLPWFRKACNSVPDDKEIDKAPTIEELRESKLPDAIEAAKRWADREAGKQPGPAIDHDAKDIGQFAHQLAVARLMWREHPELVIADSIPPELVNAYREEFSGEIEDVGLFDECMRVEAR